MWWAGSVAFRCCRVSVKGSDGEDWGSLCPGQSVEIPECKMLLPPTGCFSALRLRGRITKEKNVCLPASLRERYGIFCRFSLIINFSSSLYLLSDIKGSLIVQTATFYTNPLFKSNQISSKFVLYHPLHDSKVLVFRAVLIG